MKSILIAIILLISKPVISQTAKLHIDNVLRTGRPIIMTSSAYDVIIKSESGDKIAYKETGKDWVVVVSEKKIHCNWLNR